MPADRVEHLRIPTNGIELHAVAAGPDDGPLVILLHGFPEFWYGWRHQIPTLARAGYRVVAPDGRGYAGSEKPSSVGDYRLSELTADVTGLIDALGRTRACVAGHDWGANVAWRLAMDAPERVARLAILNVPHPRAFLRALRRRPEQWRRSWYIAFFQLPWLPVALLTRNDFRALREGLLRTSRPGTFTEENIERYVEAWAEPDAVRSMVHWYRAPRLGPDDAFPSGRIHVPTLVLWGARDAFLIPELAAWSAEHCDDAEVVVLDDATHWLQHEEPTRVSDALVAFFGDRSRRGADV